jgi:DnaJ-class molecular chaperone
MTYICGRCGGSGRFKYTSTSRHFPCNGTGRNILGNRCNGCSGTGKVITVKTTKCTRCHGKGIL